MAQPLGQPAMTPQADWREEIVCAPAVLSGKPVLRGARLSVEFVLELLAGGWDRESLARNYAHLTDQRIRAVLAYAAETLRDDRFYLLPPENVSQ